MAALAAELLQHPHAVDGHAAVHGLAHVVDGQRSDAGGGQRFHLHAGLPGQLAAGDYVHRVFTLGGQFDLDAGEQQRVAQRNQFMGLLGCLDAGDARHGEHVALGVAAVLDQLQGRREHAHPGFGHGFTGRHGFFGDIDHVGAAWESRWVSTGGHSPENQGNSLTPTRGAGRPASGALGGGLYTRRGMRGLPPASPGFASKLAPTRACRAGPWGASVLANNLEAGIKRPARWRALLSEWKWPTCGLRRTLPAPSAAPLAGSRARRGGSP